MDEQPLQPMDGGADEMSDLPADETGTSAEAEATPPDTVVVAPEAAPAEVSAPATPALWMRLRRALGWASAEERLNDLNRAIEQAPTAAVNYLLRGELYLVRREHEQAQADLQQAAALAAEEYATAAWGLSAQVIQDRALAGLRKLGVTDEHHHHAA